MHSWQMLSSPTAASPGQQVDVLAGWSAGRLVSSTRPPAVPQERVPDVKMRHRRVQQR